MSTPSDLATLVATEARLDRELAEARAAADAMRAAAQQQAEAAAAELDTAIADTRARIAAEIEQATAAELQSIRDAARAEVARYDAVQGERLAAIIAPLLARLLATAEADR